MTAIQFSIGVLNDVVDAPRDGARRPVKPLADGLVSHRSARAIGVLSAAVGFTLSAVSGIPTLLVGVAGAACGYAYDLRLSRTAWAWLPLAVALPLVPVYAWLGATGSVPGGLVGLVPIAILAGGGLAVGNALADVEADGRTGASSVATRLGRRTAWRLHALALGGAAALALATLLRNPAGAGLVLALAGLATLAAGAVAMAGGVGLAGTVRWARPAIARLGWQVEAIGVAVLGVGWVLAFAMSQPAGS